MEMSIHFPRVTPLKSIFFLFNLGIYIYIKKIEIVEVNIIKDVMILYVICLLFYTFNTLYFPSIVYFSLSSLNYISLFFS